MEFASSSEMSSEFRVLCFFEMFFLNLTIFFSLFFVPRVQEEPDKTDKSIGLTVPHRTEPNRAKSFMSVCRKTG